MTRVVMALIAVAAAVLLGPASPAPAQTDSPQLQVIPYVSALGRPTETELDLSIPAGSPAAARVVVYVPNGYGAHLTHVPGTKIADVAATIDARGTRLPLQGQAVADNPASHTAQSCAPGLHAAVWVIQLPTQTRTLTIPMYVDPTSGNETSLGAFKMQVCFASPDVPEADGGAPFGAKVTLAEIDFLTAFTNPTQPALYIWRALVTPYTPGTGTPNAAATYELRSIAFIPAVLILSARYDRRKRVAVIMGKLSLAGVPPPTVSVAIIAGPTANVSRWKVIGTARGRRGAFMLRTKKLQRTSFLAGVVPADDAAGCFDGRPAAAPAGCLRETTAPVVSTRVRLVVPKKR